MKKFRKKPVVIEAEQWTYGKEIEGVCFCHSNSIDRTHVKSECQHIHTLEGPLHISDGDWIIKGINGEFYPCKPDIFEKIYEPLEL